MSQERVNSLLKILGERIGVAEVALDDCGYCCLSFDEVFVNMECSGEQLALYAWLGTLAGAPRSLLAAELLDANYLFRGTQGATLGVDQATGDALLAVQLPVATLEIDDFEQSLENFVNVAERWRKRFEQAAMTTSAPSVGAERPDFAFFQRA